MADFGKMADDAKAKQDALAADEAQAAKQERVTRAAAVDKAVTALIARVAPLLEKARQDFSVRGIESKSISDFDVTGFISRNPSMRFRCLSPARPSDGYKMESIGAIFSSDGETIFLSFDHGNSLSDFAPKVATLQAPVETSEAMVIEAIGQVVTHYHQIMKTQAYHFKR